MAKTNGKQELERQGLDIEHELPPANDADTAGTDPSSAEATPRAAARDAEIEKLKGERDALLDRMARMQADFENARKRSAREQQEFRDYAVLDAVRSLLPIVDSFERALAASIRDAAELRSGVELIYKQLIDALAKLGLQAIPAQGEPFNPHLHEAIEVVETSAVEDHHVLEELQRGYKLKDRLVRPAMVKVARNSKS